MYYGIKYINGVEMYGGIKSYAQLRGDIIIPEYLNDLEIEFLDAHVLSEQKEIISVVMGDSIKYVGNNTFYDSSLRSIRLSNSIACIPEWCFGYCTQLKECYITDSVHNIDNYAFYDCETLEKVRLPKSLTFLGVGAFSHCHILKGMDLPEDMEFISDKAFQFCYEMVCIIIHSKVRYIGKDVFRKCDKITIVIDNNNYAVDYCMKNNIRYIVKGKD